MLCQFQVYIQQSDSVTHTHTYSFSDSQILFSYMLLQDIKYCPLCYTVGPFWLSVVFIVVYLCESQALNLYLPYFAFW